MTNYDDINNRLFNKLKKVFKEHGQELVHKEEGYFLVTNTKDIYLGKRLINVTDYVTKQNWIPF